MANEKRLKLIDYDEVRKLFDEEYKKTVQLIREGETHLDNLAEGFTEADKVIRKLPTVDAVEVVRCGGCRYCDTVDCPMSGTPGRVSASDFCSYGERRDGA